MRPSRYSPNRSQSFTRAAYVCAFRLAAAAKLHRITSLQPSLRQPASQASVSAKFSAIAIILSSKCLRNCPAASSGKYLVCRSAAYRQISVYIRKVRVPPKTIAHAATDANRIPANHIGLTAIRANLPVAATKNNRQRPGFELQPIC